MKPISLYVNDDNVVSQVVAVAENSASGIRVAECDCVIIGPTRSDFEYKGDVYDHASQDQLTIDELTLLIVANIRAAGWEDTDAEPVRYRSDTTSHTLEIFCRVTSACRADLLLYINGS